MAIPLTPPALPTRGHQVSLNPIPTANPAKGRTNQLGRFRPGASRIGRAGREQLRRLHRHEPAERAGRSSVRDGEESELHTMRSDERKERW
jgi:hypothetical protein